MAATLGNIDIDIDIDIDKLSIKDFIDIDYGIEIRTTTKGLALRLG
jgi:hypothetical protein